MPNFLLRLFTPLFISLFFLLTTLGAQAAIVEEQIQVPVKVTNGYGKVIEQPIIVTLFHDTVAPKPYPVLILGHGRAPQAIDRIKAGRVRLAAQSHWFASLGFFVAVPTRVGYGESGGADVEDTGDCKNKNYPPGYAASADQTLQVLEALRQRPDIAKDRTILVGQSFGGTTSITVAARNPVGVQAAINFAGGGGGNPETQPQNPCGQPQLRQLFSEYGKTARLPTLWVYTENDMYFGPQLPKEWFAAYQAAGGTGEYAFFPAFGSNGHALFAQGMELWQPRVLEFLKAHGYPELKAPKAPASTSTWTIENINSRNLADGKSVTFSIAISGNASSPQHWIVYAQPGSKAQINLANPKQALANATPWGKALNQLQQQGIGLVYVDIPSDAEQRNLSQRPTADIRADLQAVGKRLKALYPNAQLHVASFATSTNLIEAAQGLEGFSKVMMASGTFLYNRTLSLNSLRLPVLLLHAPSAQCDVAPFLEAEYLAQKNKFTLVKMNYEKPEEKQDCSGNSQHAFHGLEAEFAQVVADWLNGKPLPSSVGSSQSVNAWREQIDSYSASNGLSKNKLETTLLLPDPEKFGAGPYPTLVFNHGDLTDPFLETRTKSRLRTMGVAREFLNLGMAVVILPLFSIHLSRPIKRLVDLAAGPPSSFAHTPSG